MKVFQDLEVTIPKNEIENSLEQIISNLTQGWWQDIEGENRLRDDVSGKFHLFNCEKKGKREEARLIFFEKNFKTFYVSNIVPLGQNVSRLTEDQYNIILIDFYKSCLKPLEKTLGLIINFSKANPSLEDMISQESASKLTTFSILANKSTGSAHPSDQSRWFDFLVSIVLQGDHLDSSMLYKWFTEDENWLPEIANQLVIEFEQGVALLEYFRSK